MNKSLLTSIAFVAGAAVGCLSTWQYFKTKYEKIADEEVESVKQVFLSQENKKEELNKELEPENKIPTITKKKDLKEYKDLLEEVNYSGFSKNEEVEEVRNPTVPYLISFDEFGQMEDWKEMQITYYADDILVDQDDDIVMDAEDQFGYECLKEFDDPDCGDAIYVRNELLETDYEIVRDSNTYESIYDNPDYEDY